MQESSPKKLLKKGLAQEDQFMQSPYRFAVVVIGFCAMVLNGLLNNVFIPIAQKLADIYQQSEKIVNLPIILSFLIFSLINVPVNHFIDRRGFKTGYLIGLSFYLLGMFFICFINSSFALAIIGYIIFSFGQPFIVNAPAKIATHWFFPHNRALATSVLVGAGIVGSGMGFAIPALLVGEESTEETAKHEIFTLYMGYTITAGLFLLFNVFLLRNKPSVPTSNHEQKEELSLKETFKHIKKDKNIWKFLVSYWVIFGSFQTFASSANLLIKPFGATDIDISIAAILLIIFGAIGAVISSIYLKKHRDYRRVFRISCVGALILIIVLVFQLVTIDSVTLIQINVGLLGFFITPLIPISYQIGCEIAFPIGQAQITGMLNGGSLIWAFISDSLLTVIIGFGSKSNSLAFMSTIVIFISIGTTLCFLVEVHLKRKHFQQKKSDRASTRAETVPEGRDVEIQMSDTQKTIPDDESSEREEVINEDPRYETLQEQNL